jgi:hypothetical protein
MTRALPDLERAFRKAVNMTPAQIRAWAADPRSTLASYPRTRAELVVLARAKSKPTSRWTPAERAKAVRAVAFVARHGAQARAEGCKPRRTVALRNWGHDNGCKVGR